MPTVFPGRSGMWPELGYWRSQRPCFRPWWPRQMFRASAMIIPTVKSATASALRPGVFTTRTPRAVAAETSTFSSPARSTPTTLRLGAASSSAAGTGQNCVMRTSALATASNT